MSDAVNSHKNIYLADDDEDDRMLFMEAVCELELSALVTTAADGGELLELLFQNPAELPEIIFLDINMPGKNGFECLADTQRRDALQRRKSDNAFHQQQCRKYKALL